MNFSWRSFVRFLIYIVSVWTYTPIFIKTVIIEAIFSAGTYISSIMQYLQGTEANTGIVKLDF